MSARQAAERDDALQADSFVRVLRAERAAVVAEAASQAARLQRLSGLERSAESTGIRRIVRAKEAELRALDRMIDRLLRRFPPASQRTSASSALAFPLDEHRHFRTHRAA